MTVKEKLKALSILIWNPFKGKNEREAQRLIVDSLKVDLTPKEQLPLIVTEVYVDAPHVQTSHNCWPDAMQRIELVRDKERLHKIHVTRGGDIEYTWSREGVNNV